MGTPGLVRSYQGSVARRSLIFSTPIGTSLIFHPVLVALRRVVLSCGSCAPDETKTRMALASLLHTWQARGHNPCAECLVFLSASPVA